MNRTACWFVLGIFALFALVSVPAPSTGSTIQLELNAQGFVKATFVNDGSSNSIQFVTVFVATPGQGTPARYDFTNVKQGDILPVQVLSGQTASYNFMDNDGELIGVGWNKPIYGTTAQEAAILVIESASMTPVVDENTLSYTISVEADVNENHPLQSVQFEYYMDSNGSRTVSMAGGPNIYSAVLPGFRGENTVYAAVHAMDAQGKTWTYELNPFTFNLIAINPLCGLTEGDQNVLVQAQKESRISFAGSNDSVLELRYQNDGDHSKLVASHVYDEDQSIQEVQVFYYTDQLVNQKFTNVRSGQVLSVSAPATAEIQYSYMDSDGAAQGMGFFLSPKKTNDPEFCQEQPQHISCKPQSVLIESAQVLGRVETLKVQYYYDMEVIPLEGALPQQVFWQYSLNDKSYAQSTELSKDGSVYAGSIGPFRDEQFLYSRIYATSASTGNELKSVPDRWDFILASENVQCQEICFDKKDNDLDGFVDEDCAILPQLAIEESIPSAVVRDDNFEAKFTVINEGGSDSNEFEVKLSWNHQTYMNEKVSNLSPGETRDFTVSLFAGNQETKKELLIKVDPSNQVQESIETDNEVKKLISVQTNAFEIDFNANQTGILGDERQIQVRDILRRNVKDATLTLTYPDGTTQAFKTPATGIISFRLTLPGTYLVKATKEKFKEFEGEFSVDALITRFKSPINVGETQTIIVETINGIRAPGTGIEVRTPGGKIEFLQADEAGQVTFQVKEGGNYSFKASRNGISLTEGQFITQQILQEVIGTVFGFVSDFVGKEPLDWVLSAVVLALAAAAALYTFSRSKQLFETGMLAESDRRRHALYQLAVGAIFLAIPLVAKAVSGNTAAAIIALLEMGGTAIMEYVLKQARKTASIRVQ